jgi:hypothetical protein
VHKALFLYRFSCLERREDFPNFPLHRERPAVMFRLLNQVNALKESGIPVEFIMIADNSDKDITKRCFEEANKILKDGDCTLIETDCLEDIFLSKVKQHAERLLPNGTITTAFKTSTFTFWITSMEEAKKRATDDTVVFFCEADYLYADGALLNGYNMATKYSDDFITLYDHPGIWEVSGKVMNEKAQNYSLDIVHEFNYHWRTTTSTCFTFLCTMNALKIHGDLFLNAKHNWGDSGLWVNMRHGKNSRLWSAIPTLTYHLHSRNLLASQYWKDVILEVQRNQWT